MMRSTSAAGKVLHAFWVAMRKAAI